MVYDHRRVMFPYLGKTKMAENPIRILMIGWAVHPALDIYQCFVELGCKVDWIGQGGITVPLDRIPVRQFQYQSPSGMVPVTQRMLDLDSILGIMRDRYDFIFHVQDWSSVESKGKSPIPYYYLFTEYFFPEIPSPAWTVLASTQMELAEIKEKYNVSYSKYFNRWCPFELDYMPYGLRNDMVNPEMPNPHKERKNRVTFAGEVWSFQEIYKDRRELMYYLKDQLGNDFDAYWPGEIDGRTRKPGVGKMIDGKMVEHLARHEYIDSFLNAKFGINWSTEWGFNFRDLEIAAWGPNLVTKKRLDLEMMGFKDGVNCHFYESKEEALEIIKGDYDPEMAFKAWVISQQNSVFHRIVKFMIDLGYYEKIKENVPQFIKGDFEIE